MNIQDLPNAGAVFIHEDLDDLSLAAACRIAELAADAIAARGVFHLVLAGGETPRRCYEKLRQMAVDWTQVQIYFGDERCLPFGDTNRNDSMARDSLLRHVAIPKANIHAIPAELGANAAAPLYAYVVDHVDLDLVLLGMGEDGHTASLFPGNPATENSMPVVPVYNAPKPPVERVTLGMGTINRARQRIFLVAGEGKRAALTQLLQGVRLPAALVGPAKWHLDRAALPQAS